MGLRYRLRQTQNVMNTKYPLSLLHHDKSIVDKNVRKIIQYKLLGDISFILIMLVRKIQITSNVTKYSMKHFMQVPTAVMK